MAKTQGDMAHTDLVHTDLKILKRYIGEIKRTRKQELTSSGIKRLRQNQEISSQIGVI